MSGLNAGAAAGVTGPAANPFAGFRDPALARDLAQTIRAEIPDRQVKIMHVCGSHEHTVQKWSLRSILPENLEIFAGPGCPVCVCPSHEVAEAIELARRGAIIATYGDMMRVPTPYGSLAGAKTAGGDVRLIYGPMDAVGLASDNPGRQVVLFAVGFETTAAPNAALIASGAMPGNLSLLTSHRLTVPAMELLLGIGDIHIDAFIAPGHVSVITGSGEWELFAEAYGMPVAVAGFEPVDFLSAVLGLVRQISRGDARLDNTYGRAVTPEGNRYAQRAMAEAFETVPSWWRGIGRVPRSGQVIREKWGEADARRRFELTRVPERQELPPGCSCHLVMLGKIHPTGCPLFGKKCTPATPYGPCMVSHEGTCQIWSQFGGTGG